MRASLTSVAILALAAGAAAQATWFVSPSGSNANPGTAALPFQTINHANAIATPGDVIRLLPGVFGDEQGIIVLGDKLMTVIGAGVGVSTVRAHSSLTTNINTGFPATPVATQQRPVVLVEGGNRVDLRAMTIDGNYAVPASGRLTGLYYRNGADGTVSDVEVINCRANPLNGGQGVAGVVVRGDNLGDTCNVILHNCTVHRWGKVGVAAFFNADLTVKDSRVVGADHLQTGPAQVGVQIAFDAGGSVLRTSITDVYYDPSDTAAAGVLVYDADNDVVVEGCSIVNCEHAIYFFGAANTSVNGQVRRNRVVACDAGVYLDNVNGITVKDNSLQLSLDLYQNAGFSNVAGNTWTNNNYSSYPGFGVHAIPGGGGNVDATPRRGVDYFGTTATAALPVGHAGRQLVVAELNGAGLSDFATVDENSGLSVSVGINTGGAFTVTSVPFAPSGRSVAIVAGEFNNAPGRDLAVLTQVTTPAAGARVYTLANNGSGTFSVIGNQFFAGMLPGGMAAGDRDGDGIDDLVIAHVGAFGPGSAVLLANLPAYGTNYASVQVPSPFHYTAGVQGVAFGDVTGDGFLDILVTEGNSAIGRLHVLANNGVGGFAPTGYSPLYLRNDPTGVAVSDLDADGDKDIVVCYGVALHSTPGGAAVLENLGGGFRVSFYNTDYTTTSVALGNVDNDSDPDSTFGDAAIVNTDGSTLTVLGGFVRGTGFTHGGIAVNGTQVTAVAFGNFDGDPYHDMFYTNGLGGQVVVLRGRPSARVDYYGYATEGFRGREPHLAPVGAPGVPTQPNLSLGIQLSNAREFTLAAIVGSLAPAAVLLPNSLQVDLSMTLLTHFAVTDIQGRFTMPLALPALPSVLGLPLYFQGGVFDSVGNFLLFPGVSLSNGMKLRIGT